jgi:hypothetical protein
VDWIFLFKFNPPNIILMKKYILLLLIAGLAASQSVYSQLTGITPNTAQYGQSLQTTITSNGIFIQGFSPNGNVQYIYLRHSTQPTNIVTIFDWSSTPNNTTVIDANTLLTDFFSIPFNAPSGVYDLNVTTWDPWTPQVNYILPNAFTIQPYDGIISGNVYKDLNRNGIKDSGEPNIVNANIRRQSGSGWISYYTNASGDYSIPVYNGNYKIYYGPVFSSDRLFDTQGTDTINVNINNNNSTGNNFGLNGALLSVTPSTLVKGDTSVHLITSSRPLFLPSTGPEGNVTQFAVYSSPAISLNTAVSVVRLDSFNIQVTIPVPTNIAESPAVDLRLYTQTGLFGFHYLREQLSVVSPPTCTVTDSTWAKFITASSFRANWNPVPGAYRYQVYYKVGGTPTWTQRSVAGNKTFMGIQNLNCGTNYRWKVRTVCQTPSGNIKSVWSPVMVTTTLSCVANSGDKIFHADLPEMEIYPNPASTRIIVEPNFEIASSTIIEVYSLTGARLMIEIFDEPNEYGSFELNVSELKNGMYFLRISGDKNHTSRLVIQRD